MGANVLLLSSTQKGFLAGTATAALIVHNINPYAGGRISIRAFQATCSESVSTLYFQPAWGYTTVKTTAASGAPTIVLNGDPNGSAHAFASGDQFCLQLNDGAYLFGSATNWWASGTLVCSAAALTASATAGAKCWGLGIYTDSHVSRYRLTVSAINTKELGDGLIKAPTKFSPMMVTHDNVGSQVSNVQYISVDYLAD